MTLQELRAAALESIAILQDDFGGRADCPAELYSIIFQKAPALDMGPA
jgi:hypothetical protein